MDLKKDLYKIIVSAVLLFIGFILRGNPSLGVPFYILAYLPVAWEVLKNAVKNLIRGNILDENFLMSIATLGAFAIREYPEAVLVMLLYNIGEHLEDRAVDNSRSSIEKIIKMRPDKVTLLKGGEHITVSPEEANVGDEILMKPGERIPLDGRVSKGSGTIDNSPLTGEALPIHIKEGDHVLAGGINTSSSIQLTVTKPYSESTIKKIMDLVENASSKKAQTERFITKFARYYTPTVVIIALIIAFAPWIISGIYSYEWVYRSLIFLVISCPCALVLSVPLSYFAGLGKASHNGILIKGANFLDALNNLDAVAFDKTGTLTEGTFEVGEIYTGDRYDEGELLFFAAHGEYYSNHPLGTAIVGHFGEEIDHGRIKDFKEYAGLGVRALVDSKVVICGNDRFMEKMGINMGDKPNKSSTLVHVAVEGRYSGSIALYDKMKGDVGETLEGLKNLGVHRVLLLTGDREEQARIFSQKVGIKEYEAELLPHMKVEKINKLIGNKRKNSHVAFVGDGINDAPVLSLADVGIAMGGLGSDAAMESSDIVLLTDEPSKILKAIKIGKITRKIVWMNILLALITKLFVLTLGITGHASMWTAIFADVGVTLLAVLNSVRILKMKIS